MDVHCYITFPTVYFTLRAEAVLSKEPYSFKLLPVPRDISSSCGTALRCSCEEVEVIIELFKKNLVEFESVHRLADQAHK